MLVRNRFPIKLDKSHEIRQLYLTICPVSLFPCRSGHLINLPTTYLPISFSTFPSDLRSLQSIIASPPVSSAGSFYRAVRKFAPGRKCEGGAKIIHRFPPRANEFWQPTFPLISGVKWRPGFLWSCSPPPLLGASVPKGTAQTGSNEHWSKKNDDRGGPPP